MLYGGRPGLSPALATLIALGEARREHRILDVGCGTGTDVLLLARWGFRRVEGVDPEPRAIGIARARATRAGLGDRVRFHLAGAERLTELFGRDAFDLVLHTLVANNLRRQKERHFRELAAVIRPRGRLLLHERVTRAYENERPNGVAPLAGLRRNFVLSPGVSTHLAEHGREPGYARVVLWIGEPKKPGGAGRAPPLVRA